MLPQIGPALSRKPEPRLRALFFLSAAYSLVSDPSRIGGNGRRRAEHSLPDGPVIRWLHILCPANLQNCPSCAHLLVLGRRRPPRPPLPPPPPPAVTLTQVCASPLCLLFLLQPLGPRWSMSSFTLLRTHQSSKSSAGLNLLQLHPSSF